VSDDRRAYDPDEYFGRAVPREVPDLQAEAQQRMDDARAYFARVKPDEWRKMQDDAQALDDVRTLDEWADKQIGAKHWSGPSVSKEAAACTLVSNFGKSSNSFQADTPDAARHAAAEWVRAL
jgi:hypothetical protein